MPLEKLQQIQRVLAYQIHRHTFFMTRYVIILLLRKKEKRRAYVDKEVDGVLEEDGDEDEEEANGSECPCRGVF